MSTFEDITARLVADLGPLDIPEEPELLVTIYPTVGNIIQFTVSCGLDRFRDYMSQVISRTELVDFVDVNGVAHIIHTSAIIRLEIEEENGNSSASK